MPCRTCKPDPGVTPCPCASRAGRLRTRLGRLSWQHDLKTIEGRSSVTSAANLVWESAFWQWLLPLWVGNGLSLIPKAEALRSSLTGSTTRRTRSDSVVQWNVFQFDRTLFVRSNPDHDGSFGVDVRFLHELRVLHSL